MNGPEDGARLEGSWTISFNSDENGRSKDYSREGETLYFEENYMEERDIDGTPLITGVITEWDGNSFTRVEEVSQTESTRVCRRVYCVSPTRSAVLIRC
ncbi:MAG: hypothetical protein ACLFR8_09290 [Alkalispirochaeta sp.]